MNQRQKGITKFRNDSEVLVNSIRPSSIFV